MFSSFLYNSINSFLFSLLHHSPTFLHSHRWTGGGRGSDDCCGPWTLNSQQSVPRTGDCLYVYALNSQTALRYCDDVLCHMMLCRVLLFIVMPYDLCLVMSCTILLSSHPISSILHFVLCVLCYPACHCTITCHPYSPIPYLTSYISYIISDYIYRSISCRY